jgi:hypothetical protein
VILAHAKFLFECIVRGYIIGSRVLLFENVNGLACCAVASNFDLFAGSSAMAPAHALPQKPRK